MEQVRYEHNPSWVQEMREWLGRLERQLQTERIAAIVKAVLDDLDSDPQEWFTCAQFGEKVGKATYTVQQWCRMGRIRAERCASLSGPHEQWRISREELNRYRKEGLLREDPERNLIKE